MDGSLPSPDPPADSPAVRRRLAEALELDLIGPWAGHALAAERLPGWVRPSNWYLTGFLVPSGAEPANSGDADEDDDLDETPVRAGLAEESAEERRAAKRGFFPSSMGLSFLVAGDVDTLTALVRWGDYELGEAEAAGEDGEPTPVWERRAEERSMTVSVASSRDQTVPDSRGLVLHVESRPAPAEAIEGIPAGTRSVSLFLVNRRGPDPEHADCAYAFQVEIDVLSRRPFVPRPDPRGAGGKDWDDRVADLHYADRPEYAVGHGVSADWSLDPDGACRRLRTAWVPRAEVERTETSDIPDAELSMEALGALVDGRQAETALRPLVAEYRTWIDARRAGLPGGDRGGTARELLRRAGIAADRMERGLALLAADEAVLDAFRVANRAVAAALRRRLTEAFVDGGPRWRAFQLAFILLNLPGLADPRDPDRLVADLLFFPTGGGKTEAYFGLAAFVMALRRLRHPGRHGAGVTVVMRYTLRLLTLDQLGRAAGLVCALELEREADPGRYGEWPFEIGLWVGRAATPNVMGRKGEKGTDSARGKTRRFKANPGGNPSPIPLENCPWCGEKFAPSSFELHPNDDAPTELRVACANFECVFSGDRPLPILAVDEPIYRRLPAFLIATVDKFAALPWTAQTGALLGGAQRCDDAGFYGPADPGRGRRLETPLPPPDLVIQDELHLIAGPLGTMVGLYETAIEALCRRGGGAVRPKIVASTATARQAQGQIQALFARSDTQLFPPPGPDRREAFFARTVAVDRSPGRLYLGVAAPGRNPKVVMRRVWLALMGAAERAYRDAGGHHNRDNPADPYMTVVGYFNALRELGGARRILEEEVRHTVKSYGQRRRSGERSGLFQDRRTFSEVVELTSRVPTHQVAEARRRLERAFHESERVDCAIATNMIAVGLDIPRLGAMVVLGQPKTHAEYIQATSRVGRDPGRPGLVVTLLNMHKPRDRSHYERFRHYHETFYRAVEVSSVTPFSARALDRGLGGVLVGLARHLESALTPPEGAERLAEVRAGLEPRLLETLRERVEQQPFDAPEERDERLRSVHDRVGALLDAWQAVVDGYREDTVAVHYQKYESLSPGARPLLRDMLDTDFESEDHRRFRANRSLRDVEPTVNLFLRDLTGQDVGEA